MGRAWDRGRLERAGARGWTGATCALALALAACGGSPGAERPPNVLIVLLDTLRPDHLGCYGYGRPTSPQLDELARDCFLFEHARSAAPWTAPALISLMTSLDPAVHGVVGYPNPGRLSEHVTTLAEVLERAGYATAAFTEGGYAKGSFGLDQGFQHYPSHPGDERGHLSNLSAPSRLASNLDRSLQWLEAHRESPFLLLVHTYEPHSPYRAPLEHVLRFRPDYVDELEHEQLRGVLERWNETSEIDETGCLLVLRHLYHCRLVDLPPLQRHAELDERARSWGLDNEHAAGSDELVAWVRDLYDAEIRYTDEQLARLWRALADLQLEGDTIVVVVSDHGEGLGQHGHLTHGENLHGELLDIALLVRLPERLRRAPPRRITEVVALIDVMPTLLELVGVEAQDALLQGRSLVPLLSGEPLAEAPAFSHSLSLRRQGGGPYAVREGRWQMILDVQSGRRRLYDLESDPDELLDRAAEHPEVAERLARWIEERLRADAVLAAILASEPTRQELDEATRERLRFLGYVGDDGDGGEGSADGENGAGEDGDSEDRP